MLASERFTATPTMREWRRQSPELKAAKEAAKPEAEAAREKFVKAKLAKLKESGAPIKNAEAVYTAAIVQNELYGDFQLMTPDGEIVTVAEVLADRDRFYEARFADPLDPEYANDNRIAYVNLSAEKPYLYSHIHGGMLYRLYAEAPSNDCNDSASSGTFSQNKPFVWGEPEPLGSRIEVWPYPIDVFPLGIRDAIKEAHEIIKLPIELAGNCALSSLSIATQALADVKRLPNLTGPIGLFLLAVAESGDRKSTCDKWYMRAVRAFQEEKAKELAPELKEYRAKLKAWKAKGKGIEAAIELVGKKGEAQSNWIRIWWIMNGMSHASRVFPTL